MRLLWIHPCRIVKEGPKRVSKEEQLAKEHGENHRKRELNRFLEGGETRDSLQGGWEAPAASLASPAQSAASLCGGWASHLGPVSFGSAASARRKPRKSLTCPAAIGIFAPEKEKKHICPVVKSIPFKTRKRKKKRRNNNILLWKLGTQK